MSLLKQAMPSIMPVINGAIRDQLTELVGAQTGGMIPASMVVMLSSPIQLNEEVVHPIPNRNAMGNAPGLFAQLLWVSNLALALVLFFGLRKINLLSSYGIKNRLQQLSFGIVLPPLFAALIVWMAESWYGMELASSLHTWIWLMLIGYSFFFLQSALFNLIGFPATALIVLLMFFSLPIVNMAPQFLSEVTNTFIYSWSPLRLAASSVRSLLYFDGFNIQRDSNIIVLITMASISLIVLLLTSLLDKIKSNSKTKLTSM